MDCITGFAWGTVEAFVRGTPLSNTEDVYCVVDPLCKARNLNKKRGIDDPSSTEYP